MKPGLSGYVMSRNCLSLDYCVELSVQSMLPICDEVLVCDSDSTDGTREILDKWAAVEPKLRIINWPWPNPVGDTFFLVKWINFAREHLNYSMQLNVEADEVLSPTSFPAIKQAVTEQGSRMFRRHNFWRDAWHVTPPGVYCGHQVGRLGPTNLWMPSDAPDPHGPQTLLSNATWDDRLEIFHYGALRKPEAFCAKSRVMQGAIFNCLDSRIADAESRGVDWEPLCQTELLPWRGKHPEIAMKWLIERGRW